MDTVISDNPIAVSQVAANGIISKTAFLLDNKYVEAVIVTQELKMSQNRWDSSVTDYYIDCVFNFIPTEYYEDALIRTTSPTYSKKIEDKDNFTPILVTKIEIEDPDLKKEYSRTEVPNEVGWMDYKIETSEGELTSIYSYDCYPVHDTKERTWRHLNFFQYRCYITARVPRVKLPDGKVRTVDVPWGRDGSGFILMM